MPVEPDAPVVASGSLEMPASPAEVWRLMSHIDEWPTWNPDVREAHLRGALLPGTEFTWRAGPGRIRSRLTEVDPESVLAWEGRMLGITAVHEWRIQSTGFGSIVSTSESWSGLVPRLLTSTMQRTLQDAIDSGLQHLEAALAR